MPSPFPGMAPYLEAWDIWPDFHDALAGEIRRELNRVLPPPYYARMEMRPEVGIVGDEVHRTIVPDIAIVRPRGPSVATTREGGLTLAEEPRVESSPSVWMRISNEPLRHHFIEIRDPAHGHALVTLIEIASPTNKRPGPDRRAYEAKRKEILDSDTSLIELDLLRGGQPLIGTPAIIGSAMSLEPRPDYLVTVNRAWQRGRNCSTKCFPSGLRSRCRALPCRCAKARQNRR
ncbi:MAG: DUF4058 family protein [Thermoguttaceae bacterium]